MCLSSEILHYNVKFRMPGNELWTDINVAQCEISDAVASDHTDNVRERFEMYMHHAPFPYETFKTKTCGKLKNPMAIVTKTKKPKGVPRLL
jgi:hypothetical protein